MSRGPAAAELETGVWAGAAATGTPIHSLCLALPTRRGGRHRPTAQTGHTLTRSAGDGDGTSAAPPREPTRNVPTTRQQWIPWEPGPPRDKP